MRAQDGTKGHGPWHTTEDGRNDTWRTNVGFGEAWKKRGAWGTPFSAFRFAVPELCGFKGRALYLDADMLVRADVRELLEMPLKKGYTCISRKRTDVAVIDCSRFETLRDWQRWPSIKEMKRSGWITGVYCQILMQLGENDHTLDPVWNACDPMVHCKDPGVDGLKLLHYTVVPTQPYRPYPKVAYQDHPWRSWVEEWQNELAEARPSQ